MNSACFPETIPVVLAAIAVVGARKPAPVGSSICHSLALSLLLFLSCSCFFSLALSFSFSLNRIVFDAGVPFIFDGCFTVYNCLRIVLNSIVRIIKGERDA